MISISHWGMFHSPGPVLIVPKLSEGNLRRLRESLHEPGFIVALDQGRVEFIAGRDEF
jgi:hypothetical protein